MLAVLALVVALGVVAAVATAGGDDDDGDDVSATGTTDLERTTTTRRRTTTTGPWDPQPSDFTIDIVILEKQCFGSAGCSLEYEIDLTYTGLRALPPTGEWTLIYEVSGDEDGTQIGSVELSGSGTFQQRRSRLSTASSDVVPTAVVTSVR